MRNPVTFTRQQGISLVVTLILVVLMSLLALYGAGILVTDTRSAANDYRAREAMAAAESGVDQGFTLLDVNRSRVKSTGLDTNNDGTVDVSWTTCTSGATAAPCVAIASTDRTNWKYLQVPASLLNTPTQGTFNVYWMTPTSGQGSGLLYNIVATGTAADATGGAIVKQGAFFYPLIVGSPAAPMMTYGEIGGSGNYNVVTNPNGAGTGQPISAWSKSTVSLSGSAATCQLGEQSVSGIYGTGFLSSDSTYTYQTDSNGNTITMCASCTCPSSDALSTGGTNGIDVVQNDTSFPSDVFKYAFGVAYTSYNTIKQNATVLSDCSSLNTSSSGLYWITGSCSITNDVGSFANPVMIVVQDNDISVTGSGYIFGILFAFGSSGYSSTATSVHLAGGTTLYGAIMANTKIDMGNGTYRMRFDSNVLSNIANNASGRSLSRIPGSWSDVQQ